MISPSDLTDDFKAEIFTIITTSHYVLGTILEIESGSREKAVLLFRFVKPTCRQDIRNSILHFLPKNKT